MLNERLGTLTSADVKPQAFVSGAKLFTDRAYIAAVRPAALKNAHFLPTAMNGQKTLKCKRTGRGCARVRLGLGIRVSFSVRWPIGGQPPYSIVPKAYFLA